MLANAVATRVHAQLGNAHIGLGDLEKALVTHTMALEIREKAPGNGYKLAASLHKVAWVMAQRGENGEAERLLRRALDVYDDGDKSRGELGRTSYLMASVLAALGREEDARRAKADAAQVRKDVLGLEPRDDDDDQASYDLLIPFELR